jgi:hypothetical protein
VSQALALSLPIASASSATSSGSSSSSSSASASSSSSSSSDSSSSSSPDDDDARARRGRELLPRRPGPLGYRAPQLAPPPRAPLRLRQALGLLGRRRLGKARLLLLMELGLAHALPRRDGGLDLLLRAPGRARAGRDVLLDDVII